MMTNEALKGKVAAREALLEARKSLQDQIDLIEDQLKEEMTYRAVTELIVDNHTLHYSQVTSNKFDSKTFRSDMGDQLYSKYCRPTVYMRFQIS